MYVTDANNVVLGNDLVIYPIAPASGGLAQDFFFKVSRTPTAAGNLTLHIVDETTSTPQYALGSTFGGSGRSQSFDAAALVPACAPAVTDTTRPSVSLRSSASSPTNFSSFTVTATFSEEVSGITASDISASNATVGSVSTTDNEVYSFNVIPSGDGNVEIWIPHHVAQDAAGNQNTASSILTIRSDGTSPTVTLSGTATSANSADLTVTFSEEVTGFTASDVSISSGTRSVLSSSDNTTFTLSVTGFTSPLSVSVFSGAANDLAGNRSSAATGIRITPDVTPPAAVISTTASSPMNGTLPVTVQFTEEVANFTASDVVLGNATLSSFATTDDTTFTFTLTPAADGTVTAQVPASVAQDTAGNQNTASNQLSVVLDNTHPTVTVAVPTGGRVSGDFPATVTFSEQVTGFVQSDVAVSNGTVTAFSTTDDTTFNLTIRPTSEGNGSVFVGTGTAHDLAGNRSGGNTGFFFYDTTAPRISAILRGIVGDSAIPSPTSLDSVSWSVVFAEGVSAPKASDYSVSGTTAMISVNNISSSVSVVTLTGGDLANLNGTVTLGLSGGQTITDTAGNALTNTTPTVTNQNTFDIVNDVTPPTVAITTTASSPTRSAIPVTVTFSEVVSGFTESDLVITNGTVSSFMTADNRIFTFTLTPAADGAVSVNVGAGAATDGASNPNTAGTALALTSDTTAPTVTSITRGFDGPSPIPETTDKDTVSWFVTFSEAVARPKTTDFSVSGTTAPISISEVSSSIYEVSINGGDLANLNATVTLSFAGGQSIVDLAGNALTNTTPSGTNNASFNILNDTTPPTLTITSRETSPINGAITVNFEFSEAVTGFLASDITAGNASVSGFSGSGTHYSATITPTTDGAVTVDVAANAASDGAGNGNTAASQFSVTADLTAPTVLMQTSATSPHRGSFSVIANFSESVTGFAQSDVVVTNGTITSFDASGRSYLIGIRPTADGTVTVNIPANSATDAAGNGNTAAAQLSLTIDATNPGVILATTAASPHSGAFTVTATFTESVTGFELGDIGVANGAASALTGSGASYSFTVTPDADGVVAVSVGGAAVTDAAGNISNASNELRVTTDGTKPSVTLSSKLRSPHSGPFTVLVGFSEDVTGFDASDVTVSGGVLSGFTGSNDSYSFTVTPSADGTITVGVAAGVAADAAGNTNTAATDFTVTSDSTAPTVAISSTAVAPHSGPIAVTFTFSETVTGFEATDVTVGNGVLSGFTGSGATYTATVTPSSDGVVTVDVAANVANDLAGNRNTAASQYSLNTDSTAPVVTIGGPDGTQTEDFTISITVSETVTGLELSDFAITNGTLSNLTGSGTSYTATVTPVLGEDVSISVNAGAVSDAAGNTNLASSALSVETGTPTTQFEEETEEVQQTLGDEGQRNLKNDFAATGRFIDLALGDFMADRGPNALPGGGGNVGGNANVVVSGKDVNGNGFFTRSDEYAGGRKRYVLGQFDIARSTDGSITGQLSARYGWEFEATEDRSVGYFIGAGVSQAEIKGTYEGEVNSLSGLVGLYAMEKLDEDMFITAYGALGYTQADLKAASGSLALDGTYGSTNAYLGAQLLGRYTVDDVELRPSIAVDYGLAQVGVAGFDATAFGVTQPVTHDFGNVEVWNFSLAQEAVFQLGRNGENGTFGVTPSLECQSETNSSTSTRQCGGGLGFEYRSGDNRTTLGADYRNIQGNEQLSLRALYELEF